MQLLQENKELEKALSHKSNRLLLLCERNRSDILNVEMNSHETKKLADQFLQEVESFNQNIKALYKILDDIETSWKGIDASNFLNAMRNTNMLELEKIKTIAQSYGEYLKNVPNVYAVLDEQYRFKRIE